MQELVNTRTVTLLITDYNNYIGQSYNIIIMSLANFLEENDDIVESHLSMCYQHLPYLSSHIWPSFFFKSSHIFSAGFPNDSGFATSRTSLVADVSAAPM